MQTINNLRRFTAILKNVYEGKLAKMIRNRRSNITTRAGAGRIVDKDVINKCKRSIINTRGLQDQRSE